MTVNDVIQPLYPDIYSQNRLIDHASTFPKRMVIKVKRQTIARTRSYCEIRIGCENHVDIPLLRYLFAYPAMSAIFTPEQGVPKRSNSGVLCSPVLLRPLTREKAVTPKA